MTYIPTHQDILRAAQRIEGKVLRSPLVYSNSLSVLSEMQVFLKLDSLQPGGSFKIRGATNAVALLSEDERRRGVVAASAGNHGTALALAAQREGIKATIVLPENAPSVKVAQIRKAGATLLRHGDHYGDSEQEAARLAEQGLVLIHPFDDPQVVAGQGTIALEIAQDAPADFDTILVPVGGGGLIAGVALGLKYTRPNVEVVGVEPLAAPSLTTALNSGKPVPIKPPATYADGLSPRSTGEISFKVARERIDRVLLLTEDELMEGCRYCFKELHLVVEPSGAAAISALIAGKLASKGHPIVIVISGSNLDPKYFPQVMN